MCVRERGGAIHRCVMNRVSDIIFLASTYSYVPPSSLLPPQWKQPNIRFTNKATISSSEWQSTTPIFLQSGAVSESSTSSDTISNADGHLVGVLGATGSVGQRFILLLAQHPHFQLTAVGASPRSAGKAYKDAVKWKQATPMSKALGELVVKSCTPEEFKGEVDIVFSGLDSDVAEDTGIPLLASTSESRC